MIKAKNPKKMAFEKTSYGVVNVGSINYEKYLNSDSDEDSDGNISKCWSVIVPLSLKGGGSINLGWYESEEEAKKAVDNYVKEHEENNCEGCCDGMANQEAHYGGCMRGLVDEEDDEVAVLRGRVQYLERQVMIENKLVGKLKERYNVSNEEIGKLVDEVKKDMDEQL